MAPVVTMTASATVLQTFHRFLHDSQENDNESTGIDRVFWAVNGFILALLVSVCSWFWCCGGIERITAATGETSDQHYQRQVLQRRQQREAARQMTPDQRKQTILQSIQRHQVKMVVQETDLVEESQSCFHEDPIPNVSNTADDQGDGVEDMENSNIGSDPELGCADCAASDSNHGYLQLRHSSLPQVRQVPNCCAICLGSYQVGDAVVWSSNPECLHAFHEDCLLDWLVHGTQQAGTPCPVCRQAFTDLQNFCKERKIRWDAGRTMDLGAVSLR